MTRDQDIELVQQCRQGDKVAMTRLVDHYQRPVFNAAYRLMGNREDADDVTQTVFLKIFEHLDDYNSHYKLFSWIYRIAINEALGQLKRRRPQEPLADSLPAADASPEQQIDANARGEAVQACLMQLSQEYRTVVVLKHFSGFSYHEISEMLGVPEKTVKSRLYTARQNLKQQLLDSPVVSPQRYRN